MGGEKMEEEKCKLFEGISLEEYHVGPNIESRDLDRCGCKQWKS